MSYEYKARDPLGKHHTGSLQAESREEAMQQLRRDGLHVLQLEEVNDGLNLLARRIQKTDIIYATNQLAVMVDTGINLSEALSGLAEQEENPTLQTLLRSLKNSVEGGEDFSAALARFPKYFDKTYIALVRASEETGSLGSMLDRIAGYLRSELETRSKVRAALAYPAVMLVLAVGVTVFLLTFVMPKFAPLFSRRGTKLPKPTILMMSLSDALTNYWWAWLLGIAALVAAFLIGRRTEVGRRALDWLRIHAPVTGKMVRKVTISRSIRTLGAMIQGGVSMLEALRLCSEVSGNYYYEQAWLETLDKVTQGSRICEALQGNPLFPATLVQMIGSGEETGKLDYVLEKISGYYDREVETSLKTMTSLIEPVMITVMGAVIGTIGLSVLLPIFSLSRPS